MQQIWAGVNAASDGVMRTLRRFLRENAVLLGLTIAVGVVVYGYVLTHLTFSIDEELVWQTRDPRMHWLDQRRWGMYLIQSYLLPLAIYPFTSAALAIVLLSLSAVLVVDRDEAPRSAKAVFCSLFVEFPTFAHIQSFEYMGALVAFAVLLVVLAERLVGSADVPALRFLLSALVALTIATAAHQSLIFIFPTLVLFSLARAAFENRLTFPSAARRLGVAGGVAVSAVAAFYAVSHVWGLESNGYVEGYLRWGTQRPSQILSSLYASAWPFLIGTPLTYAVVPTAVFPLVVLPVLALRKKSAGLAAGLVVALALSALLVHVAFGTWMSSRSMMAVPFAFAGLWYLLFREGAPVLRLGILVFTGYVTVIDSSLLSRASLGQELTYKSDVLVASRVLDRVYGVDPRIASDGTPIAFVGKLNPPRSYLFVNDGEFGGSFWEWDGGNPYRMYLFLQSLGLPVTVQIAAPQEWPRARRLARQMPAWPDDQSVALRDGLLIVKLSD